MTFSPEPRPGARRTTQRLLPAERPHSEPDAYDPYPTHFLLGPAYRGIEALARQLPTSGRVLIDGTPGTEWDTLAHLLDHELRALGTSAQMRDARRALLPQSVLDARFAANLGGQDPLFGRRFEGDLEAFFDPRDLDALNAPAVAPLTVVFGPGAALRCGPGDTIVYVDLPKNETQFRARAGRVTNLSAPVPIDPRDSYKRSYFLEWPALRRHAARLLPRIDLFVDGQRDGDLTFTSGESLRSSLSCMAHTSFRVRPWFEPGPWGGQWLKQHVPDLPQDVPNYAWSFELITPENGLLFEANGLLVEVSFDFLMAHASREVIGESAERFEQEFPIRFDYLDTVQGGNLSLQVHPKPEYIRTHFGERFTQDETYYIFEAQPGASVYLGFQEGVDRNEFRRDLEHSLHRSEPVDVGQYIQRIEANRGDLFLIPSGTVHCAGEGTLVLEISATPYIFTFKMYDWLRLDLDGRPRPLNLERAFENLDFSYQGERVTRELVSNPCLLDEGDGWRRWHLPTHDEHFYDVHRLDLDGSTAMDTGGTCHVLNVVFGARVRLTIDGAPTAIFRFAETFVVSAAAKSYRLTSEDGPASVVVAFLKLGQGPR